MPHSVMLSVLAAVFGLLVGSFLNVLIYRLPRGRNVVTGRSACPACGRAIAWYDNVPIASYVALKGRCRHCRQKISPRYPVVEGATGAIAAATVWFLGMGVEAVWAFVFFGILLVVTLVDWSHRIIPDSLSLGGAVFGLAGSLFRPEMSFVNSLVGGLMGFLVLLAVALAYRAVRKADGMGGGDIKLMAMIGAFLGWRMVLPVLILASFAGTVYGLWLMKRGASAKTAVPFGSFLAPSAAIVYVIGPTVWDSYVHLALGPA